MRPLFFRYSPKCMGTPGDHPSQLTSAESSSCPSSKCYLGMLGQSQPSAPARVESIATIMRLVGTGQITPPRHLELTRIRHHSRLQPPGPAGGLIWKAIAAMHLKQNP